MWGWTKEEEPITAEKGMSGETQGQRMTSLPEARSLQVSGAIEKIKARKTRKKSVGQGSVPICIKATRPSQEEKKLSCLCWKRLNPNEKGSRRW